MVAAVTPSPTAAATPTATATPTPATTSSGATAMPTAGSTDDLLDELLGVCEDDPETDDLRLTSLHTYPSGITLPADLVPGASCLDVFQRLADVGWVPVQTVPQWKFILPHFGYPPSPKTHICGIGFRGGSIHRFTSSSPCVIIFTLRPGATPTAGSTDSDQSGK